MLTKLLRPAVGLVFLKKYKTRVLLVRVPLLLAAAAFVCLLVWKLQDQTGQKSLLPEKLLAGWLAKKLSAGSPGEKVVRLAPLEKKVVRWLPPGENSSPLAPRQAREKTVSGLRRDECPSAKKVAKPRY